MRDTGRTRLLLSVALIAALALIAVSYEHGSSSLLTTARNAAGTVIGGAERAVSAVVRPVSGFVGSGLAGDGGGQVARLRRKLAQLRGELSAAQLGKTDYRQLSRMLGLAGAGGYRVVPASVIAFGQGYQQTVTLDAGSSAGIRPQMTVLDGDGLVGQVVSVSQTTCTVLLASDASSVVGVRLAPGGQIGWVTGSGSMRTGTGLFKLQVLDPAAVLKPGQRLVTSASVHDRPFVPGVPVGVIVSVHGQTGAVTAQALVRPYADFTSLNVVAVVIAPPARDPRFSVLPPKPAPTPATSARPGSARPGSASGGPGR